MMSDIKIDLNDPELERAAAILSKADISVVSKLIEKMSIPSTNQVIRVEYRTFVQYGSPKSFEDMSVFVGVPVPTPKCVESPYLLTFKVIDTPKPFIVSLSINNIIRLTYGTYDKKKNIFIATEV